MRTKRKSKLLCDGTRKRWTPKIEDHGYKDEDGWCEDIRDVAEPQFHAFRADPADPMWFVICARCKVRERSLAGLLRKTYSHKADFDAFVNTPTPFWSGQ